MVQYLFMSNTNPARGMRDFLPADIRKRNYVIGIIREVYEKYGFEPLETPSIENLSTLTNKYGEEGDQLMFKILKRGEKLDKKIEASEIKNENELTDLALRYDLTVPLARVVANYKNDLPKFFKRYQIQPVWRADRPARGRYREFYQCDVDAIGSKSMIVEAELCSAVSEILEHLGFNDFIINVNHREILQGMLNVAGVPNEQKGDALIIIDKRDKIGRKGIEKEFDLKNILQNKEVREVLIEILIDSFDVIGKLEAEDFKDNHLPNDAISEMSKQALERIRDYLGKDSNGRAGLKEIENILKLSNKRIGFNPNLARGLSYYTGAIFEVILTRGDFSGSIAGGGRYDGLIGMFGKEEIPAVGFSLGLERILLIMEERGMFPDDLRTNAADVLVTVWNEQTAGESLKLANELRQKDLRVLVYPQADKLGKQFKYADQIGIENAIILRDEEIAENKVKIKNLQTGEEEIVSREKVFTKINVK